VGADVIRQAASAPDSAVCTPEESTEQRAGTTGSVGGEARRTAPRSTGEIGRSVGGSDCWGAVAPAPGSQLTREVHLDKHTTAVVPFDPVFADPRRLALGGFLAGYSGLTRDAYALDLRQFVGWCDDHQLDLFAVRRANIEAFARALENRGRARATVARRLCTVTSFYRYAEEEGLLAHSPAVHVRRPRIDYESHATGLDRNEVGALLVAAGLGSAGEHALVSLLVLNGLRVSEATGADIDRLGLERGHRTLTILRKGGKIVTIPLAPRTARAIDLALGERLEGPIFAGADGQRLDRHAAGRIVRRAAKRAGINKRVGPHTLRHAFITAALDAGVPLRDVQEAASHADPRTTMRYDRARVSLDRHATYIVAAFLAGAAR
jgi:integrase/recombinase XerD